MRNDPDFAAVAAKHGVDVKTVETVWMETFRFISGKMRGFEFMLSTRDEVMAKKTDFVLPGLGKLRLNRKRLFSEMPLFRERTLSKYRRGELDFREDQVAALLRVMEIDSNNNTDRHERNQGNQESEGYQANVHEDSRDVQP